MHHAKTQSSKNLYKPGTGEVDVALWLQPKVKHISIMNPERVVLPIFPFNQIFFWTQNNNSHNILLPSRYLITGTEKYYEEIYID